MIYTCHNPFASTRSEQEWTGEVNQLKTSKERIEMTVNGRGSSFHVIIGQSSRGGYLCIPDWQVGCPLASFSDRFWNQERLEEQLGLVDAITIATAIKEVDLLIKSNAERNVC